GATDGRLAAPSDASGSLTVSAKAGSATTDTSVRVLGRLHTLELSASTLSFPDSTPATLSVTGRDADGFAAPIELEDMDLSYDHAVIAVDAAPGGLKITPLASGATH